MRSRSIGYLQGLEDGGQGFHGLFERQDQARFELRKPLSEKRVHVGAFVQAIEAVEQVVPCDEGRAVYVAVGGEWADGGGEARLGFAGGRVEDRGFGEVGGNGSVPFPPTKRLTDCGFINPHPPGDLSLGIAACGKPRDLRIPRRLGFLARRLRERPRPTLRAAEQIAHGVGIVRLAQSVPHRDPVRLAQDARFAPLAVLGVGGERVAQRRDLVALADVCLDLRESDGVVGVTTLCCSTPARVSDAAQARRAAKRASSGRQGA